MRRLKTATVTLAKRGVLVMVIFLTCYVPLVVILLVFARDHSRSETALLAEGLTLPISYVHAVLSPVMVIRVDQQWRRQTAILLTLCRRRRRSRP